MVQQLRQTCENLQGILKDGVKNPAGTDGMPEFNATSDELRDSLGENAWAFDIVLEFVLDGKSNKIVREVKAAKAAAEAEKASPEANGTKSEAPVVLPPARGVKPKSVK